MIAEIVTFFVVKESNPHIVLSQKRDRLQKLTSTPLFLENEISAVPSQSPIYDLLLSIFLPWKVSLHTPYFFYHSLTHYFDKVAVLFSSNRLTMCVHGLRLWFVVPTFHNNFDCFCRELPMVDQYIKPGVPFYWIGICHWARSTRCPLSYNVEEVFET